MYATSGSPFSVGSITAGALLGTTGSAELVDSINASLGGSMFSDTMNAFRDIRNSFVETVIRPIQMGYNAVSQLANVLMNPDVIRPLITEADFKAVPPCMYEAIVMFPPVRSLLTQGRISGFGFDPEFLPEEDVWGRLIENGTCHDVLSSADENGDVWLEWHYKSTDPDVTVDELEAVEATRNSIRRILDTTRFDPTDYPEERG